MCSACKDFKHLTGGEGATVREILKHKSVEKVVMVDIDEAVTSFCKTHLEANTAAFEDPRLELINDDARTQLEQYPGKFDVIVGDLADPVEGGPCYQVIPEAFIPLRQGMLVLRQFRVSLLYLPCCDTL